MLTDRPCHNSKRSEECLLSPAELTQKVDQVTFQDTRTSIRVTGDVSLGVSFGMPTRAKVLIRNSGSDFCEDRGATTTIVAFDAEG